MSRLEHPRPQLVREHWASLDGPWDFASTVERDAMVPGDVTWSDTILVPIPPEAPMSGVDLPIDRTVFWYRRTVDAGDLERAGAGSQGEVILLHFGAIDYRAWVWWDGALVGTHEGGQAPFSIELPVDARAAGDHDLVVCAEDDPHDVEVPRGKQDWREQPHAIWYQRTSGIWQTVWLEAVPRQRIAELAWTPRVPEGEFLLEVTLSRNPEPGTRVTARLEFEGQLIAEHQVTAISSTVRMTLDLARQHNGQQYEELLWSPEHPRLLDASISLSGRDTDTTTSYAGLRSAQVRDGHFLLNEHPYFVRSVLNQGYRESSHLAAASSEVLRAEVQLIKDLGFNAVRVHQKAEDPRFLAWADRLGLLVWAETANAFQFSARAVAALTAEWIALVRRDRSHPCIVTWVPINESWGVQHVAVDFAQRAYVDALTSLTRALDPTRPVISNDGWEHRDSDIVGIHDYSPTGQQLLRRYGDEAALERAFSGPGPVGRKLSLNGLAPLSRPIMLTEFGGIAFNADRSDGDWGYSTALSAEEYKSRLQELLDAVRESSILRGFCLTQLMDTGAETNGLVDRMGRPKLPVEVVRSIITGQPC